MANTLFDVIKFTPHDYLDSVYLSSKQGPIFVENYFEINYATFSDYVTNRIVASLQTLKPNDLRTLKSILGLNVQSSFSEIVKVCSSKLTNLNASMLIFYTSHDNPSSLKKKLRNLEICLPEFLIDLITTVNCSKRIHKVSQFENVSIIPTKCQISVPGFQPKKIIINDYIELVSKQSDLYKICQLLKFDEMKVIEDAEVLFTNPKTIYDISFVKLEDGSVNVNTGVGLDKEIIFMSHLIRPRHKFQERNICKYRTINITEDEMKEAFRNKCIGLSINDGNLYENINNFVSIDKDIIVKRDLAYKLHANLSNRENDEDKRYEEPAIEFDGDCENERPKAKELDPNSEIYTSNKIVDYTPTVDIDTPEDNEDFVNYIRAKTKSERSRQKRAQFDREVNKKRIESIDSIVEEAGDQDIEE